MSFFHLEQVCLGQGLGAFHNLGLDGELVTSKAKRFHSNLRVDAANFEHDGAGFDDGCPAFRAAFTGTHTDFGRLLGKSVMWEDTDPNFSGAVRITGEHDTSGFDLVIGDVSTFKGHQTIFAEVDGGSTLGFALIA